MTVSEHDRDTRTAAGRAGWRAAAEPAARRLAAVTATGALLGLLVGGIGGRLAMMLLARLNPATTGITSDDGFTMGRLTVANTLNLLLVATMLGVVGAGVYSCLRGLRIGPKWFRLLSLAGGSAVVVGAQIVHTDGVDFAALHPTWLAIGLFVAIPGVYTALLTVCAERVLARHTWWARAPLPRAVAPLLLWLPVAPLLVILAAGWAARERLRRTSTGAALLGRPALPWVGRLALAVLFALALLDLVRDAVELD